MNYYLVALLDTDSYMEIEGIQRKISKKYNIYRNLPKLHITLEVIKDPDIKKLEEVVTGVISPYKKFRTEVKDEICFAPPYKSVNLKVENKGYLCRITRLLDAKLKENNFKLLNNRGEWDLHISLANTNFAKRQWSKGEYQAACDMVKNSNYHRLVKIEKLELWKPINNKREMVVKEFLLK
ncbi:MAG: 2'-5' RNA ligase family protein [Clostridiaceae bacterium]